RNGARGDGSGSRKAGVWYSPPMRVAWVGLVLLVGCQKVSKNLEGPAAVRTGVTAPAAAPPPAAVPPPAAPSTNAGADPCAGICDRVRPLGCKHNEGCVAQCREMRQVPTCASEMTAVLGCFGREPVAHWECSEDGTPAIKDGFCDAEQSKFVACVQK